MSNAVFSFSVLSRPPLSEKKYPPHLLFFVKIYVILIAVLNLTYNHARFPTIKMSVMEYFFLSVFFFAPLLSMIITILS